MITGVAHSAVCVPDVEEATRWYSEVLGLRVLSLPFLMTGEAIERDMGELLPSPVAVKAAILGVGPDDRVLEVIEYPEVRRQPGASATGRTSGPTAPDITAHGLSHVGLVCDDLTATRAQLEQKGVEFLTTGIAEVAGLRSTWFVDPFGVVFILLEKSDPARPYWRQWGP